MSEMLLRSSMGVKLVQHVGTDASVVAAAKVSTEGAESVRHLDGDTTSGLIRYLMRQRHGTPFEHASLTFLVEAPIFVFREWHRHRVGWSFNETSGRYRELEPVFWVPDFTRKVKPAPSHKPSRPEFVEGDEFDHELIQEQFRVGYVAAWESYQNLVAAGYALEVCRSVLPVGTYSAMYATANPRSLMHFLSLRTHHADAAKVSYPQAEIEDCAFKMETIFRDLFPLTHAAFCEFGRQAP